MNDKTILGLIAFSILGLIVCVVLISQQSGQLRSLQNQIGEQDTQLGSIRETLKINQARQASNIKIRSLASGVYELSTEVTVDPFDAQKDRYTIYNFVLDIRVGAVRRKLQFGYGYSGLLTHVIYFDHDSDGIIDTKMMNDYAKSIPGLEMAAGWLIEPEHSQAVYDAFRLNVDSAKQLTMDGVSDSADAKIGVIWEWLNDQTESLSKWAEDVIEFD